MARQILPIAGQIIGGMVGGPVGAAIGGAIGGALGAYVDPLRHQGPKLGEARAQTAQEGVYRPLVFGTGCVSGNIIHRSERKVVVHRESAGGKGNRDTVDTERGYRTFAIRIAEAHTPDGYALLRIWENETLVYDARPESAIPAESDQYSQRFRFYSGSQDQLPDPDLEAYMGVGNVNSYRGSCYIVFGNFDLTDYGDMVPQYRFEVASAAESGRAVSAIAIGRKTGPPADATAWSEDGVNWHGPLFNVPGGHIYQASLGSRVITWGHHGAYTNDDLSGAWAGPFGPFSGIGGDKWAYTNTDTLIIPGGLGNGVMITQDGQSYSHNLSITSNCCAVNEHLAISLSIYSNDVHISFNDGSTWEVGGKSPVQNFGSNRLTVIVCDEANFVAGGRSADNPSKPALARTDNQASSWSVSVLSASGGENVTHIVPCGGGRWVAATDNGELWYSYGGETWAKAAQSLPDPPTGLAFNGRRVIASSGHSSGHLGPTTLMTAEIDDLSNWTVRSTPLSSIDQIVSRTPFAAEVSGEKIPLSSVVEFCHRRVGMADKSFDASSMDDLLDGVVFADNYTARDAITALLPIYNADASEHDRGSGYRINYIKRGAPVARTLTIDDLVDEPEETVREDPMERPRVLHMAFESPVTGYTAGKASILRLSPDVKLVNEVSTYVPVTFKDVDEAWQRADVQMRVAWTEVHGERTFSIADDQLDVVPTDVLALSLRGQVQRLRVLKVEYADGVLKLETVADRQSNYTSHVTGIPLPAPEKPPPSLMGPAAFAILDIPAISDQHDRLGYYVAVCGTTEAYAGAVIQRQQNGEWADVVRLGRSQRAIMGVLENTVSAASEHYTDTTNTVSVALYMDDELESLSNAQWLNKGGAFALETATGWEIMQYRDAYQDSGGVWHLSHLARGRLNTTPDEHLPGARFVMLSGAQFIDADVGMIDKPLTLRAAAVGRSPETAVPETITYQGNSQREFPVASLTAEVNGSDLDLSAIPRDRFGTEQHPVRSANHDGFRWAATDGSATVTADSDHATASLDVSGLSAPITATVAQLNRFTGAGPTVSEQV